ncbi:MAG TPA: VOC family protein [Puia sp.]|nr:VOC family protein [Puia sp.]
MKRFFLSASLSILVMLIANSCWSQDNAPHVNHVAVYVVDLQKSADFYERVMQLKRIPEPFHDGKHVWMKLGEHSQLHIISGASADVPHDINVHLAFAVASLGDFIKHLKAEHVKFGNWAQTSEEPQTRADGIKQVYLQDPDGYWIEVNNDRF